MHCYQLYILTISLILCFTIGYQHQINAKPIEDLITTTFTTSLATTTNETKSIYALLPPYFQMQSLLMPFAFPLPFPNNI
ncbi:unnamed protein product [Rotaria sp. Silwood1]|nr:unnamed protein product [Rotaria sp. Silwood1]